MKTCIRFVLSAAFSLLLVGTDSLAQPSDNLVAYYPFNGNSNDESGNNRNLTNYGATPTADRFGNANSAYSFDGVTSYLQANGYPALLTTFTYSAWIKLPNGTSQGCSFGCYGIQSPSVSTWDVATSQQGRWISFYDSRNNVFSTTQAIGDQWTHIVIVYASTTRSIYIDGALSAGPQNISTPIQSQTSYNLRIGRHINGAMPFPGMIDDIRIYNRALSAEEINQLYHEQHGLVAYYPFNGNSNDESGNNRNLTNFGATLTADRFGNANSAYSFDGVNSYLQANGYPALLTTFTYSAWIKITEAGPTRNYNFGCYGVEGGGLSTWDVGYNPFGPFIGVFDRTNNAWMPTLDIGNQWTHIVIVYASTTRSIYIDGAFFASQSITSPISSPPSNNFRIGRHIANGSQEFQGMIDDIRIYSCALTADEIACLYNPPTITVSSPNGGEFWVAGGVREITWTDNISEDVRIELYRGISLESTIAGSTPSSGSFFWVIPRGISEGTNFKIKITSTADSTIYDWSDNNFTISAPPPPTSGRCCYGDNYCSTTSPAECQQLQGTWTANLTCDTPCSPENCLFPYDLVDMGDLNPCNYPTLVNNPAHGLSNIAWLGTIVTADPSPNYGGDGGNDGITYFGTPWTPCTVVQVAVQVTDGENYQRYVDCGGALFLSGWKDGNLDGDFCDTLCGGSAPEWIVHDQPVQPGLQVFSFNDPGVFNLGVYPGVFRWRLTSHPVGAHGFGSVDSSCPGMACGTFASDYLGEVEDYCLTDVQLAVELTSLAAVATGSGIEIRWTTASEIDNDRFEIHRSSEGSAWSRIGTVPGLGTSSSAHQYTFLDEVVESGIIYSYRLACVDLNGSTEWVGDIVSATPTAADIVPGTYALRQNYPNPFNPMTSISFDLVDGGPVTLKVYNTTGQEVATVVNSAMTSGRHTVTFDASHLPSGMYLYRLEAGSFTAAKKMLLMK